MRKQLLNTALNTENNLEALISDITKKDLKFLDRKLTALQNQYDDAEEELEKRLSQGEVIDDSVVTSLFGKMADIGDQINLYTQFEHYYNGTELTEVSVD